MEQGATRFYGLQIVVPGVESAVFVRNVNEVPLRWETDGAAHEARATPPASYTDPAIVFARAPFLPENENRFGVYITKHPTATPGWATYDRMSEASALLRASKLRADNKGLECQVREWPAASSGTGPGLSEARKPIAPIAGGEMRASSPPALPTYDAELTRLRDEAGTWRTNATRAEKRLAEVERELLADNARLRRRVEDLERAAAKKGPRR